MENKARSNGRGEGTSGQEGVKADTKSRGAGRNKETGPSASGFGRREFIKNVGKYTAAGIAVSSIGLTPLLQGRSDTADGQEYDCDIGPEAGSALDLTKLDFANEWNTIEGILNFVQSYQR